MFSFPKTLILIPQSASTGYALVTWPVGTYPNSPQVITMDSIDTINAETYAINNDQDVVPPGSCANVGDCFLSVSHFDSLSDCSP
jgi:hypothetical protein